MRLLLDTCALIWLTQDKPIAKATASIIEASDTSLFVSVMTAWELGMLVAKGRVPANKPPERWFDDFVETVGVEVAPATPRILIAASFLPPPVHKDPTDSILIATAREHDLTLVTRDRAVLAYGKAGHVRTLPC